ncbi:hypothetical protein [Eggerthella sinensis]|uniref:hypothetical protein n=1 Tax=Eggerthella sinensis TaxID=242230 RepID=UPI0022DF8BB9|nr:hypothetical protein [Eggerthella sinensis]
MSSAPAANSGEDASARYAPAYSMTMPSDAATPDAHMTNRFASSRAARRWNSAMSAVSSEKAMVDHTYMPNEHASACAGFAMYDQMGAVYTTSIHERQKL